MKFIYRGEFSKGLDTQTIMAVTFHGREPSEVTDAPAVKWFTEHPEYEAVPEPVDEGPEPVATYKKAAPAKKPAKKRTKAKK